MATIDNFSESDLIEQLRSGNQEGCKALFERYYIRVFLFVNGFVKCKSLSEDIVQNVFMKLWVMRATLYGVSLNNLLFTIARNEVKDYFRSHYYSHIQFLDDRYDFESSDDCVEDTVHARLIDEIIDRSIERLSARRKEIFNLSRREHLSNKEIAAKLNISVRTVEKSLEIALRQIRQDVLEKI